MEVQSHYKLLSFISPLYPVKSIALIFQNHSKGWLFYL